MIDIGIRHVTKRFGPVTALDQISLTAKAGEIFFLLGPSGCGKTTLLRSIAGFIEPDSGGIFFGDEEVTRTPAHRRGVALMFQSYALWPHLNVAENVAFGLKELRLPRAEIMCRVGEALEAIQMGAYSHRKINELSGGQQQRVALARAMVVRPRALLLDEPLSNLDAKLRLEMRAEIRRVCKEAGLTAIYVTHDQKEALSIADRMAVLDNGKVAQIGTPEEVYRRPLTRTVAGFIGETNLISGEVVDTSPSRVTLETRLGRLVGVPVGYSPPVGQSATASVRPEAWRIVDAPAAENGFTATLTDLVYLGEVAQIRTEAAGIALKIFELNPRPHAHRPGMPVRLTADPEDIVVLTE